MIDMRQLTKLTERYKIDLNYYEGYVVDNADPYNCSRVKVEVQGLTLKINKEGKREVVEKDMLPWYPTMQSFGEGGNSGTNIPPINSRVLVIYPTDDIYNGIVIGQVASIAPLGSTTQGVPYKTQQPSKKNNSSTSSNNLNQQNAGATNNNNVTTDENGNVILNKDNQAVHAKESSSLVEVPSQMKRVYIQPDGTKIVKEGGTRAWRNNNEGNIRYGAYAKSKGAIGQDKDGFAIFPNEASGQKAKEDLIFEGKNYKDKKLDEAIYRYAPPNENNTELYQKNVLNSVDNQNKKMSDYSPDERKKILASMRKMEGYKEGKTYTA